MNDWSAGPSYVRIMPGVADTRTEHRFGEAPKVLEHSTRHPSGYVEIVDPTLGTGRTLGGETRMCAHCQFTWVIQPSSGAMRGFCLRCNAVTCGKPACETRCDPFEKKLERIEAAGRAR